MSEERPWAKAFRRRCPAVAWISPDNFPRCDLRYGHEGAHVAERGMDEPSWVERWVG